MIREIIKYAKCRISQNKMRDTLYDILTESVERKEVLSEKKAELQLLSYKLASVESEIAKLKSNKFFITKVASENSPILSIFLNW